MLPSSSPRREAPAYALAMMVAANGHVDERELHALEQLDAFRRLGVPRERFEQLARECLVRVGHGLAERSWLAFDDLVFVDGLLDAVHDPAQRLLVCRLAAAVITADGRVSHDERLVYDHALSHWHIRPEDVAQAILKDH